MHKDSAHGLMPIEYLYHYGDRLNRLLKKRRRLPGVRVVSIGNITTGGTGKTPAAIYFARMLMREGFRVGILSRGYGGTRVKSGGLLSDGKTMFMKPEESGDEPWMLAGNLPGVVIGVGRMRYRTGMDILSRFPLDVVLLDDGFQHYGLYRDVDIVLIDATRPFGNGHLLPQGSLREPISALRRSDIIIITKCNMAGKSEIDKLEARILAESGHTIVFRAAHTPGDLKPVFREGKPVSLEEIRGREVVALSGIGNSRSFENMLRDRGARITPVSFRDHHQYSQRDVESLLKRVTPDTWIVTTEKDRARLLPYAELCKGLRKFFYVPVDFTIEANELLLTEGLKGKMLAGKPDSRDQSV